MQPSSPTSVRRVACQTLKQRTCPTGSPAPLSNSGQRVRRIDLRAPQVLERQAFSAIAETIRDKADGSSAPGASSTPAGAEYAGFSFESMPTLSGPHTVLGGSSGLFSRKRDSTEPGTTVVNHRNPSSVAANGKPALALDGAVARMTKRRRPSKSGRCAMPHARADGIIPVRSMHCTPLFPCLHRFWPRFFWWATRARWPTAPPDRHRPAWPA